MPLHAKRHHHNANTFVALLPVQCCTVHPQWGQSPQNIMYTQLVPHLLGNRQLAIVISVPQLCNKSHWSPHLVALISINSGRGSHSCSLIFFRESCFSQSAARAPDEVHDLSPTLTATTVANRAAKPSRKALQRQVREEMEMVSICSISILVTGSCITWLKNIKHVYYYICSEIIIMEIFCLVTHITLILSYKYSDLN